MQGVVIKSVGSLYYVAFPNGEIAECKLRGKFRTKGIKLTNPVAVGDLVAVEQEGDDFIIHDILPRKNYIVRKSVNLSKQYHVIASNIDQAMLVVTIAKPVTTFEFMDRFLVSAEAYKIPTTIVVNKLDLYGEEEKVRLAELMEIYEEIGYPVIICSVEKNINLSELEAALKGKTSVLVGHSGVGKSTILNLFVKGKVQKTASLSAQHQQGQHTTTFAEMLALKQGGFVVDTPGIKGLGVVDIQSEELSNYFPEFFKLKSNCFYHNCVHINEPKCAVKQAIEDGEISPWRYRSYLSIYNNDEQVQYR